MIDIGEGEETGHSIIDCPNCGEPSSYYPENGLHCDYCDKDPLWVNPVVLEVRVRI